MAHNVINNKIIYKAQEYNNIYRTVFWTTNNNAGRTLCTTNTQKQQVWTIMLL